MHAGGPEKGIRNHGAAQVPSAAVALPQGLSPAAKDEQLPTLGQRTKEVLVLPELLQICVVNAATLLRRLDLPEPQSEEILSTIRTSCLVEQGADAAEVALLAALLRASPEVKRLSDWASSMHPPKGVLPLHAGTFALLGAIYFHSKLVKFDAAFASRTVDEYGAPDRSGEEPKAGMLKMLSALAKEPQSPLGYLSSREEADTNTSSQMHLLGGMLSPVFAEISREDRSRKRTAIGTLFSKMLETRIPPHLTDIGLLEKVRPSHLALVMSLGAEAKERETRETAERLSREEEQRAKDAQAESERQSRLASEKRYVPTKKALERVFIVTEGADQGEARLSAGDKEAMVLSAFDIVKNTGALSDSALYLILDHCPRGTEALLMKAMIEIRKRAEDMRRREHGFGWGDSDSMDNASIGLLCSALERVALITNPARFEALPKELLRFLEANNVAAKGKVYTDEFMLYLRRATLALHEERCSNLILSS